jgi:vancomycin resistance protein YoaR
VDTYGEARYFELGRDAAVEYAYRDLRAINDRSAPIMLSAQLDGDVAIVEACAAVEQDVIVDLAVEPAAGTSDGDAFAVSTRRTIVVDGVATAEDVGLSVYRRPRSPVMEAAASIERR